MAIKIRFLKANEASRLSTLIEALQIYQRMIGVTRLPKEKELVSELIHRNNQGKHVAHNKNTFVLVAVDASKSESDDSEQLYIVGYMIYFQSFIPKIGRQMYITSFFIEEAYRKQGIGKKFMQFLRMHAKLLGNGGFDVPYMNDNFIGQKFYKAQGAYSVNDEYILKKFLLVDV